MPYYESVFIARQDITAAQAESLANNATKIIEDQGGKVAKVEQWGLRTLAYRIKKNRKGHYVLLNIDAPPEAIQEMERQMRINEDVLRQLTIRVDELEEGPSTLFHFKESRDDRPRHFPNGKPPDKGDAEKLPKKDPEALIEIAAGASGDAAAAVEAEPKAGPKDEEPKDAGPDKDDAKEDGQGDDK